VIALSLRHSFERVGQVFEGPEPGEDDTVARVEDLFDLEVLMR
jgi:hypothetical protein